MSSTWYHLCIPLPFLFRSFTADSLFDSLGRFSREITFWRPVWSSVCGDVVILCGCWCRQKVSKVHIFSGHTANVLAQSNQLRRCVLWGYGCHKKPGHKKGVRIREAYFSIELGIYIFADLKEFQLWIRWGEHKIATEPETGATTVRSGSKLGLFYSVRLVGLSRFPLSTDRGKCGPNLLCLCCDCSQTIQLSMSLSGAEAMKIKSSQTHPESDKWNSWCTRWTRDN